MDIMVVQRAVLLMAVVIAIGAAPVMAASPNGEGPGDRLAKTARR